MLPVVGLGVGMVCISWACVRRSLRDVWYQMTSVPLCSEPGRSVISLGAVSSAVIITGDAFCNEMFVTACCSLGCWASASDDKTVMRDFTPPSLFRMNLQVMNVTSA